LLAAAAVFVSHLSWFRLTGGFLWQLQPIGHGAVIVFFVLSGFVIQYAARANENTMFSFMVARFARLYSVVLPALLLTFLCDWIGTHHDASSYYMDRETSPLVRLATGALFLSQSWQHMSLLSNDPFWSLPYEFWYYQLFATALFLKGWLRPLVLGVEILISGPAILLLFPIWLMGVVVYRMSVSVRMSERGALLLWVASVLAAGILYAARGNHIFPTLPNGPLLPPNFSIADYFFGLAMAANIFAASYLPISLGWLAKPVVAAAGATFALYLFHLPLLHLASAFIPHHWTVLERGMAAATFALISVAGLSVITERRKRAWRSMFTWLFSSLSKLQHLLPSFRNAS